MPSPSKRECIGGAVSGSSEIPFAASVRRSRRPFAPLLLALALLLGLAALWPSAAGADPTYGVMNAPEGVYWRSEPNWAAAERISGFGVYDGTVVEVHCYASGTSVEGSADTMWEQASDVGGPGYGSGWLNEHFINDGQPINQPSPGVPPCGSTPAPPPASPPVTSPAGGGLVFSIFNAEGGIYYRYGPHWGETTQTPGEGVYDGDQVELICGAFGDAVGPYADTAWSKVRNLSRPVGEGWVNEHFINDGAPDNGFVSGEPMCPGGASGGGTSGGGTSGGGTSGGGTSGGGSSGGGTSGLRPGGSLYFSPYDGKNIQIHPVQGWGIVGGLVDKALQHTAYVPSPATLTADISEWNAGGGGSCTHPDSSVVPYQLKGDSYNGRLITTVAAWSIARSAPLLFLEQSEFASEIHYVLLFDPGDREEYATSNCPKSMYEGLALWLGENPVNRLVVLAGKVTADYENPVNGHAHAGIQNYLFPPIREFPNVHGQNIRRQVVVCNYDNMTHEDVWRNFRGMMNQTRITLSTCPKASPGEHVVSWNP